MTHESHIPHHPKIWLMGVVFHISKKYDSQEWYSTSTKNMIHKSDILHQQKYDCKVIYYISQIMTY